jgi:hypothetical protein
MRVTSHRCFAKVLLSQILALFIASQTYALGTDTHARLNEYLVKKGSNEFSTDLYLKNELGIPGGIETQLRGHINGRSRLYKVWEWIRDGGILEDSPWYYTDTRSRNHYHEPLSNQGFQRHRWSGFASRRISDLLVPETLADAEPIRLLFLERCEGILLRCSHGF